MNIQQFYIIKFLFGGSKSKIQMGFRVVVLLITIIAVGRLQQVYSGSFYSGDRQPYLQSMSSKSVVIRWQTAEIMRGQLRYGVSQNRLNQVVTEDHENNEHEVHLHGLLADTQYYYSVGNQTKALWSGSDYHFRTSLNTDSDDAVRVWVLGDPGYNSGPHHMVRDSMLSWAEKHRRNNRPDFDLILTTGDNAYRSGTNEQFQKNFFDVYRDIFINTPVWPAYGNHDARRWAFFNIFTFPENAEAGGVASHSEHYYSFDYGTVHFVMLDSINGAKEQNDEMLQWLKKDLKANKSRWLVAVMHHPPYSKGNQDSDDESDSRGRLFHSRENILPVLEKYGVDLVLSGHSHSYERSHLIDCHYGLSSSFTNKMLVDKGESDQLAGSRVYSKSNKTRAHQGGMFAVVGSTAKLRSTGTFDHPVMDISLAEYGSLMFDIDAGVLTGRFINQAGLEQDVFVLKKDDSKAAFKTSCR